MYRFGFSLAAVILISTQCRASIVTFNLTDPSPAGGSTTAGELFESGSSATIMGVTLSASSVGGPLLANGTGLGVNAPGGGDVAGGIDVGESITLTVSFAGPIVTLANIDFSGVGGSLADAAFVNVGANPQAVFFTGQPNFNGSTDVFTPPPGSFVVNSGTSLVFTAADSVALQGISFDVTAAATAVPEPSSFAMLAILGSSAAWVQRRRSKRAQAA